MLLVDQKRVVFVQKKVLIVLISKMCSVKCEYVQYVHARSGLQLTWSQVLLIGLIILVAMRCSQPA